MKLSFLYSSNPQGLKKFIWQPAPTPHLLEDLQKPLTLQALWKRPLQPCQMEPDVSTLKLTKMYTPNLKNDSLEEELPFNYGNLGCPS